MRVPLAWFSGGHLVESADEGRAPLLLLGADSYGRDVFSRLLFGARTSLEPGGRRRARRDAHRRPSGGRRRVRRRRARRCADARDRFRDGAAGDVRRAGAPLGAAARPRARTVFALLGGDLRGRRRAVHRARRPRDRALGSGGSTTPSRPPALGAGHARVLVRHLLPAARGFIVVEITMLVPAFIVAEATLSYVGLGFPDPVASWGTMLHDASNVRVFADFPWLLSPAAAMFLVVLGLNLVLQDRRPEGLHYERPL